jgi:hypothetical protein
MGLGVIDQLGAMVEKRWNAIGTGPRHFSDIALSEMTTADLPAHLTAEQIIDWALETRELPPQQDLPATFGQPPVTLFRSRDFYIEALFWIDGSTIVHQHAFSGAFLVLEGSSIETRYEFRPSRPMGEHLVLGDLRTVSTTFLKRGDVREIASGVNGLIHALFHLERPSVTIVVRTVKDAGAGPQFNYTRPGVAYDPFFVDETLERALQIVTLMRQIDHPGFEKKVGDLVDRLDVFRAFRTLLRCAAQSDLALLERLIGRVRDREAADIFRAAFEESRRLGFLISRRSLVKQPHLRFFLGVLLNAHRRQDVLALVRSRISDRDPAVQVAAMFRELSTINLKLQAGGMPWQPNVLGIPEMNDAFERSLANALAGGAASGDESESRFLEALRRIPSFACLFS